MSYVTINIVVRAQVLLLHLKKMQQLNLCKSTQLYKDFFLSLQKRVYSANSGDVFSFTLSHHAADRYQGQRNQTWSQNSVMSKQNPSLSRN